MKHPHEGEVFTADDGAAAVVIGEHRITLARNDSASPMEYRAACVSLMTERETAASYSRTPLGALGILRLPAPVMMGLTLDVIVRLQTRCQVRERPGADSECPQCDGYGGACINDEPPEADAEKVLVWDSERHGYWLSNGGPLTTDYRKAAPFMRHLTERLAPHLARADLSGWINHDGDGCPVPSDMRVEIEFENGILQASVAEKWNWCEEGEYAIARYRPRQLKEAIEAEDALRTTGEPLTTPWQIDVDDSEPKPDRVTADELVNLQQDSACYHELLALAPCGRSSSEHHSAIEAVLMTVSDSSDSAHREQPAEHQPDGMTLEQVRELIETLPADGLGTGRSADGMEWSLRDEVIDVLSRVIRERQPEPDRVTMAAVLEEVAEAFQSQSEYVGGPVSPGAYMRLRAATLRDEGDE